MVSVYIDGAAVPAMHVAAQHAAGSALAAPETCSCSLFLDELQVVSLGSRLVDLVLQNEKFEDETLRKDGDAVAPQPTGLALSSPTSPSPKLLSYPWTFVDISKQLRSLSVPDHYAALGVPSLRFVATEQDLRKGYKQRVLSVHPDKQEEDVREEEAFKQLKLALEVLLDKRRRLVYDSELAVGLFGEIEEKDIPTTISSADEFFSKFGPLFDRMAVFAEAAHPFAGSGYGTSRTNIHRLLPTDASSTPEEEAAVVDRFYSYWFSFRSWKDYSWELDDDELDLERAGSREERRWMERHIERHNRKRASEDSLLRLKLVEACQKLDPRIQKRKEKERLEKETKKRQKEEDRLEKERIAEAERQRAAEEAARAEQEKAEAKARKEKEQRALRLARKKLRDVFASASRPAAAGVTEAAVEQLCAELSRTDLEALAEAAATDASAWTRYMKGSATEDARSVSAMNPESTASPPVSGEEGIGGGQGLKWNKAQQAALEVALKKVPPTDTRRWQKIAEMVPEKTPEECEQRFTDILELYRKKREQMAAGGRKVK